MHARLRCLPELSEFSRFELGPRRRSAATSVTFRLAQKQRGGSSWRLIFVHLNQTVIAEQGACLHLPVILSRSPTTNTITEPAGAGGRTVRGRCAPSVTAF